jgi:hypothetical protein
MCCALTACAGSAAPTLVSKADTPDSGISNPVGLAPSYEAGAEPDPSQRGPCETTFQAIARGIFEPTSCVRGLCHTTPGPDLPAAGLDLTPEDAYQYLVGVPARAPLEQPLLRVAPGDEMSSFLYLKLLAAEPGGPALPGGGGATMPLGLPPLAASQMTLLKLWIRAGAPETGVVDGTQSQVDDCQRASN